MGASNCCSNTDSQIIKNEIEKETLDVRNQMENLKLGLIKSQKSFDLEQFDDLTVRKSIEDSNFFD